MTLSMERPALAPDTSAPTAPVATITAPTRVAAPAPRPAQKRSSPGTADSVRESYLVEMGKLSIAVGRIETMTAALSAGLRIDAETSPSLVSSLTALEACDSTPPWSSVTLEELAGWASSTRRLVEEAHALRAAVSSYRFRGTLGDVPRVESADGSIVPADEHYLQHLTRRLRRNEVFGHALESRLEHIDSTGRSWAWARWQLEARDASRASEFGWLTAAVEGLPREWREWLAAAPGTR